MESIEQYVSALGQNARRASRQLAEAADSTKRDALRKLAAAIRAGREPLLTANAADIAAAESAGLERPLVERLRLNDKRIAAMADGVEQIAAQTGKQFCELRAQA